MATDMTKISEALWKDPSNANWKRLGSALPKSGIKYYKVFYQQGKVSKTEDLRDAYVELYDSKEKLVAKVPVYEKKAKGIRGATIYLVGLLNTNK
ncbi:MAG: hypothetical protein KGH69_03155 [Candidatus Micrarchaeota archaeon]|nr:hypothetical protein [Candidatus Micrarchaeota archaeon]